MPTTEQPKRTTPETQGFCKRIIPCLDVKDGRTVKGVQFTNLRDIGDPVALAEQYQEQGADELMFLDISASVEGRSTMVDVVAAVAQRLMIPFSVGGGISQLAHAKRLLDAGADKVSVNTAAVTRPELISEIAEAYGSQCCVLAIDAKRRLMNSMTPILTLPHRGRKDLNQSLQINGHWKVFTHGGKQPTGLDALQWAQQAVQLGAGEILLTSWDQDGTRQGFDLALTRALAKNLPVPVIASGGASGPQSFIDVFQEGYADAALAASIFHDGQWRVDTLKAEIQKEGIPIRR